jgi:hypothetical protein
VNEAGGVNVEIDKADSHIHTTTTTTTGGISPQTSPLRDTHSKGKVSRDTAYF